MQITNNSSGSGVKVNLIKGVSSEAIAEALIRINEQELNIIGYESQTKTYRDETSVLRDNAQVSANNANVSATNANNSVLLSTAKANEASLSANNAKASELLSAQYKADNENIKTNVQTLSNSASNSANTASIKASEASSSAIISTTQANISTTKASEASTYATNSNISAVNALSSENKAEEWASKEYGLEVEPGLYSAKHYATEANNTLISMNSSVNPVANTIVKRDNNSDILTRTLNTTIESTSDTATKYYVETNNDGYLRPKVLSDVRTEIAGDKVTKTGNETIDGIKTFTSNIVGNITGNAATVTNGVYTVGNQIIDGVKTFNSSPIVPTPTTDTQAVNKVYVDNQIANRKSIFTGAYGLDWNETTDTYTRTGSDNYLAIQSLVRRCVLKADGTVNYYLHPDNSNFKEDGTPSKLDGTDGNVMVEVPKFYYKYQYITINGMLIHRHSISLTPEVGYDVYWSHMHPTEKAYRYYPAYQGYNSGGVLKSISGVYPTTNQSIATFRSQATANGSGWHQIDFSLYEALTLLCIIEYGTMNIQGALGQGRTMLTGGSWTGGSLIGITGLSNSLGNKSGNYTFAGSADAPEADLSFMSYRGCENFFGNVWRFVDGINATGANSKTIYVNNNPATYASDVFTGDYYSTGVVTAGAGGYARKLGNSNKGFFPTDVTGGASNIGTTDYYHTSATVNTIALVGGGAYHALNAGPLDLAVSDASSLVSVDVGSGVAR